MPAPHSSPSRPSWTSNDDDTTQEPMPASGVMRASTPTWNPYPRTAEIEDAPREAVPPPEQEEQKTKGVVRSLFAVVKEATPVIVKGVRQLVRGVREKVASTRHEPRQVSETSHDADRDSGERISMPSRLSVANSLDGYRPERDIVAPISVRPNGMELLWVCGDCGEHYPRAQTCPEECTACGAPKQHFYAPIED